MEDYNYQGNTAAVNAPYPDETALQKQKELQERRMVRKTSSGVGFFVLVYYLVMMTSSVVLTLVVRGMRIATADNENMLNSFLQMAYMTMAPLIAAFFYRVISRKRLSDAFSKSHVPFKKLVPMVLLGMMVAMLANQLATMFDSNISLFHLYNNVPDMDKANTSLDMILSFVVTAIVPAFAEEFAFRGIVMGSLRKHGDAFAIIGSAVLFGAMHGNTTQIIFAFTLGLIFGYIDCKANSIVPSIIIHFANNFYAILHDILSSALKDDAAVMLIYTLIIGAFYLLGLLSFVYLARAEKGFFKMTNEDNTTLTISLKDKIAAYLTNAGVIISLSLFLIETLGFLSTSAT